jgi:hypothetical protein
VRLAPHSRARTLVTVTHMWRLRVRILVALVPVAFALIVAVGVATTGAAARHDALPGPFAPEGTFDAAGNPEPSVDFYPDGAASAMHWSICPPPDTGVCRPIASVDGTAYPGAQPAGTVFELSATYQGKHYSGSLTWQGTVRSTSRPVLRGRPRYGQIVTAHAGTWEGGWGAEDDQLAIEACRTAHGTQCVMLSGEELQCPRGGPCGSGGGVTGRLQRPDHARAQVGNWYTGWYLFALDARLAESISGLVGYSSPAAIPPRLTNATVVRSTPAGPVMGPAAPRVRFLAHARVGGRRVQVADVRCVVRCRVWLTVSRVGRRFASGQRVAWSAHEVLRGSATIGVRGSIPAGRLAVAVNIGDGPYLHGHTTVPQPRTPSLPWRRRENALSRSNRRAPVCGRGSAPRTLIKRPGL